MLYSREDRTVWLSVLDVKELGSAIPNRLHADLQLEGHFVQQSHESPRVSQPLRWANEA
jgi:hypothetical protein